MHQDLSVNRKAVSSVLVAMLVMILVYGAIFSLLILMNQPSIGQAPTEPHLLITYSLKTQYLNVTNIGPGEVVIEGFAIFNGADGYVLQYHAALNPGQGTFVYLYSALKANETVAVLTDEGPVVIRIN